MSERKFIYTTAISKIRAMKSLIRVVPGGTYAGKSFAIICCLIQRAMTEPGIKITVVSETITSVRNGAAEIFKQVMEDTNRWDDRRWTSFVYKFGNGSRIQFTAYDTVGKAKMAGKREILFINEANHMHFNIAHALITRSDETYIDFNPDNIFWVHKEILTLDTAEECVLTYLDNEAISINKFKDLMADKAKGFHDVNKSVDDEKNIKNAFWANYWKVYGLGRIGNLQGTIFNNWQTIKTIPPDAQLLGIGLDFGFAENGDEAAAVAVYKMDNNLYINELIYERGLDNPALSKLIKSFGLNCEVVADSSEPKSIEELKRMGIWITGAEKGPDSIIFGIKKLSEFKIYITDTSTSLIEEFSRYTWAYDKNGTSTGKPIDKWNHGIDAVRYLCIKKLFARVTGGFDIRRR